MTEVISLDENYKGMFIFDKYKYINFVGNSKGFVIVSVANYDENQNNTSTDYYYINRNNPEKIFLFSSNGYNYDLKIAANENEFIMSTNGFNYATGENENAHVIIFKITESGVESKRLEGISIDSNKIDNNAIGYNMQGYISNIKINENNVIITLTDIKMKKEDDLVSLFSDMSPYLFRYSISGNVKGVNINFTDYSDVYNPKTETLFGFINESGTLKGRIAISEGSNQIRIVSDLDTGRSSIQKTLESAGLTTRKLFLDKPHKIVIGESIPLAVILQSQNMKIKETNQVGEFIKNPKLFEQYDNSYVVSITFYDERE